MLVVFHTNTWLKLNSFWGIAPCSSQGSPGLCVRSGCPPPQLCLAAAGLQGSSETCASPVGLKPSGSCQAHTQKCFCFHLRSAAEGQRGDFQSHNENQELKSHWLVMKAGGRRARCASETSLLFPCCLWRCPRAASCAPLATEAVWRPLCLVSCKLYLGFKTTGLQGCQTQAGKSGPLQSLWGYVGRAHLILLFRGCSECLYFLYFLSCLRG